MNLFRKMIIVNQAQFIQVLQAGEVSLSRLVLKYYRRIGLNEENLVMILQLKSFIDQGDMFPDVNEIGEAMDLTPDQTFAHIHDLIKKKVLALKTSKNEAGKTQDIYSLEPLYERLFIFIDQEAEKEADEDEINQVTDLYQKFEEEFGRPLSPIEIETLNAWIDQDQYSPELIHMALRQSVLNQVYSLRYIDRILLTWQRKNITTKEQVIKEEKKFQDAKDHSRSKEDDQPTTQVPLYNWLNDTDQS